MRGPTSGLDSGILGLSEAVPWSLRDYLEVGITDAGDTFAAWGEGFSYDGPGGVWYALGR